MTMEVCLFTSTMILLFVSGLLWKKQISHRISALFWSMGQLKLPIDYVFERFKLYFSLPVTSCREKSLTLPYGLYYVLYTGDGLSAAWFVYKEFLNLPVLIVVCWTGKIDFFSLSLFSPEKARKHTTHKYAALFSASVVSLQLKVRQAYILGSFRCWYRRDPSR